MGLGCLAYGGVGVYMLIDKKLASLRRISLIGTIFFALAGILILLHVFGMETLVTLVQLLKMLVIITGVILIFWALIIRNEATKQAEKPAV
jgi:DMSO reductase anchor subunit